MAKDTWDNMTNEELCLEYQKTRDERLFEYFYQRNKNLAFTFLKKMYRAFPDFIEDIDAAAMMAMHNSMLQYDETREAKWSTLYPYVIKKECRDILEHYIGITHIPVHVMNRIEKAKKEHPEYIWDAISLEKPIEGYDDELFIKDILVDNSANFEKELLDDEGRIAIQKILKNVLKPRELYCIRLYFGFDGDEKMTLDAIGKLNGIGRERVRQVIEKGLGRLKRYLDKHPEDKELFYNTVK